MRHHTIITGTGRSGTTFLVQMLTELGLDTGFTDTAAGVNEVSKAGLEPYNIRDEGAPYVVKSPHLSHQLSDVLASGKFVIDHAIVPMRDLFSAAESRRFVEDSPERESLGEVAPGGLWGTDDPAEQENYLARQVYELMRTLAVHTIPLILLDFPRLALDADYLFERLNPVIPRVSQEAFDRAFAVVARPELIHRFDADTAEHRKRTERLAVARARPQAELEKRVAELQAIRQEMLQERKVWKRRQDVQKDRITSLQRRVTRQHEVLAIRNRQLAQANENLERLQEKLQQLRLGSTNARSIIQPE